MNVFLFKENMFPNTKLLTALIGLQQRAILKVNVKQNTRLMLILLKNNVVNLMLIVLIGLQQRAILYQLLTLIH